MIRKPSSVSVSTSGEPTRLSYTECRDSLLNLISDAVLLNISEGQVLASAKHPTTPDVTQGIQRAIQSVLDQVPHASDIQAISIGTTVCHQAPPTYPTQFPIALCKRARREKSRPSRPRSRHPSLRSIHPWDSSIRWFPTRPEKSYVFIYVPI